MSANTSRSANTDGAAYIPYQIDFVAKSVGKQMKSSKRRLRWKFGFANLPAVKAGLEGTQCRASEHEVEVIWSVSSGKLQITCDDEEVDFTVFPAGEARRHVDKTVALPRPDDKAGAGFRKIRVIAHAVRHNGDRFPQYNLKIDGEDFDKFPTIFELGSDSTRSKFAKILKNVEMPGETAAAPTPIPPKLEETEDKIDEGHREHQTVQEENLLMKSIGEGTPGVASDAAIAASASPSVYASELASLGAPISSSGQVLSPNSFALQNTPAPTDSGLRAPTSPSGKVSSPNAFAIQNTAVSIGSGTMPPVALAPSAGNHASANNTAVTPNSFALQNTPAPTDSGLRAPTSPSGEVSSPNTFAIQNTPVPIGSGTQPPGALTPPAVTHASPTTIAVNIAENKDNPFKAYVEPKNPAANEETQTEKKSSFASAFEQMVNLDDINMNQEPEHAQNKGGVQPSHGLQSTQVGNAWARLQQPTLQEMRTAKQG